MNNVIALDDYRPTQEDKRSMQCAFSAMEVTKLADDIRADPALYTKYKNDLLEISFQACRALDAIETIRG